MAFWFWLAVSALGGWSVNRGAGAVVAMLTFAALVGFGSAR